MKKFSILFSIFLLLQNIAFAAKVVQQKDEILNYQITATKLENSRNKLSAKTGQSSYSFNQANINNLPQAQTSSLNQVLLRAPGVTQNSFGQIHIRGEHSNVQYRINDVMIPQGISGFGDSFDTHFAESIDLLRGALPAQYGYQTAGVVDIKTKGGKFENGGRSEILFGGNQSLGYNQQISGFKDRLNYYLNASYLQNSRGIESPTASKNSLHNDTKQDKLFGYFSYLLDAKKRLSLILANSTNRFEIPNKSGQARQYDLDNIFISSSNLNSNQKESNRYAILALQGVSDSDVDYQISLFSNQSKNEYKSDYFGDLIYSGISSNTYRSAFTNGAQGDFSYELNDKNTLRSGFFISDERARNNKNSGVFLLADHEEDDHHEHDYQATQEIININDKTTKNNRLYGFYLQDEFKATEKLTLNLGLRFDQFSGNVTENQLSPRLGATYNISAATKIHGGYARYFSPARTTNLSNITVSKYVGTTGQSESSLSDKVRPQRSNYYDIGISHKVNSNLNLSLDTYLKQSKNLLDEHQYGNSMIYSPFNYEKGKSYGIEFGADYQKNNFSAFFNFAAQKARARNINSAQYMVHQEDLDAASSGFIHVDHDQSYTSSFGANYLFYQTNYGIDGFYGSGLRSGEGSYNTMPSYIQINASASRDFDLPIIKKTNFRLAMLNIFDNIYQLRDGSGIAVKASQYGPRRTLYLIISKSF